MKLLIKSIFIPLFFVSCEYDTKIVLSEKLPLKVTTEDKVVIKRVNISHKEKQQNYYHTLLDLKLNPRTTMFVLDSLISEKDSLDIINFFVPYENYSLYIRTAKGSGNILFQVDSLRKIIISSPIN